MVIHCCEEHVELAIDVIIDEKETFPVLEKVNIIHNLYTTCEYCDKPTVYIVSNERSHT
ncbi:CxxH/CxxC protein [Pueribacillus sp. YX66]|uniref:CxxH/CxxC protein n=1 Tax=Pueribacillus sp. YX66 TaxID=3229242 RepID=UPI00358D7CB4